MEYLLWLTLFIWTPAIILWAVVCPNRQWLKVACTVSVFSFILFSINEWFIVKFPLVLGEGNYLGIRIVTLPLEDYLFFITYPLLVVSVVAVISNMVKETT